MSITSVDPGTFVPTHFDACTERAIGRRVQWLALHNGRRTAWVLDDIMSTLDEHRAFCTCFRTQLAHVEADLKVVRRQRAAGAERDAAVAELTARRDAIKAAIEATR